MTSPSSSTRSRSTGSSANLLTNALRHGAPPIVLSAEQRDTHLCIAVTDHGAGVPDVVRPRLFEPFERGPNAGGSGLGLAIARAYARAHGGDLVYNDEQAGARFEFVVPHEETARALDRRPSLRAARP